MGAGLAVSTQAGWHGLGLALVFIDGPLTRWAGSTWVARALLNSFYAFLHFVLDVHI